MKNLIIEKILGIKDKCILESPISIKKSKLLQNKKASNNWPKMFQHYVRDIKLLAVVNSNKDETISNIDRQSPCYKKIFILSLEITNIKYLDKISYAVNKLLYPQCILIIYAREEGYFYVSGALKSYGEVNDSFYLIDNHFITKLPIQCLVENTDIQNFEIENSDSNLKTCYLNILNNLSQHYFKSIGYGSFSKCTYKNLIYLCEKLKEFEENFSDVLLELKKVGHCFDVESGGVDAVLYRLSSWEYINSSEREEISSIIEDCFYYRSNIRLFVNFDCSSMNLKLLRIKRKLVEIYESTYESKMQSRWYESDLDDDYFEKAESTYCFSEYELDEILNETFPLDFENVIDTESEGEKVEEFKKEFYLD